MLRMTLSLKNRYPLHIQIASLFTLLILIIGAVIILFNHHQLTKLTESSTLEQYQKTGKAIAAELNSITHSMSMSVNMLASLAITENTAFEQQTLSVERLSEILNLNKYASAIYSGHDNGDFFLLRRASNTNRPILGAPPNTEWIIQRSQIAGKSPIKDYIFLDAQQQIISNRRVEMDPFDPRLRTWFTSALQNNGVTISPVYIYQATKEPGITFSKRALNRSSVVGMDISLASLSEFLQQQNLPIGSQAVIIDAKNDAIASLNSKGDRKTLSPVLMSLLGLKTSSTEAASQSHIFTSEQQEWYGSIIPINENGYQLIIATPSSYLTANANQIRNNSTLIACALLLLSLPIIWFFSLRISHPLIRLRQDADAISHLHFDERESEPSIIQEIDELHASMKKMKLTLNQFISMGNILAAGHNFAAQMEGLLLETTQIASMSGGIIFLNDDKNPAFRPIAFQWKNQAIDVSNMPKLAISDSYFTPFNSVMWGRTSSGIVNKDNLWPALHEVLADQLPLHFIIAPIRGHDDELFGFLLLFDDESMNHERKYSRIQLVNALVGSLSISVEAQHLLQEQKSLLDSFIKLIAGAIDAKSAYTGGHCQRVPVITEMLAKAAVEMKEGPFADFTLSNDEWEELNTACWLHDCGKITTPEFVVDKATKLETIYNRIHEIRMRFEVLKREKEIDFLRQCLAQPEQEPDWSQINQELRKLDEDYYFIAQTNIGQEGLSDEAVKRIHDIAQYRWTRTLDDRTGLGNEEMSRKNRTPQKPLPAQEPLLADKEEHIIYRDDKIKHPEYYDFKVQPPTHLYNHGEVYNLSIRRGTLTEEDRYKINEHIIQTIIMLKKLPFPRTMSNVPTIAGGHHERMDGKGYPNQLNAQQMSLTMRMMAIADVFEALTAADRPYKSGKKLSESLTIMANMVNDNHLDRQLFVLFIESGIWQDYAKTYLQPDQVDLIDITTLLRKVSTP
ncbi:HAMP domain-containing protein [Yersinia nurmii]|uniref:HAMP domain-containing protein n=2 Tax=Yersinia nurmii TaxID=685706 RepID=A0ABM9S7J2_9GAMM|nr:HAMP domain-containing protein [Yersinia nurmii]